MREMVFKTFSISSRFPRIWIESRTYNMIEYMVDVVSNSSRGLLPIYKKLKEEGYKEDGIYVDKYGHVRIVYKNLSQNDINNIKYIAKKYFNKKEKIKRSKETLPLLSVIDKQ